MMRFPLVRKSLRDLRFTTLAIGAVVFGIALLDVLIYPSYKDTIADIELPPALEGFVGEAPLSSPEGFLSAEFFSWIPIVLVVISVMAGTAAVGGEEGAGTIDILLAQPIRRRRILLERFAGGVFAIAVASLVALPGFLIAQAMVDFPLGFWKLLAATLTLLPAATFFLAFAMWAGAALPTRGAAIGASVGLVVVTYFLQTVLASIEGLKSLRYLSPFYWGDGGEALLHGFQWLENGLLLGATAIMLALAVWSFDRRDVTSGGSDWSLFGAVRRLLRREKREQGGIPARNARDTTHG